MAQKRCRVSYTTCKTHFWKVKAFEFSSLQVLRVLSLQWGFPHSPLSWKPQCYEYAFPRNGKCHIARILSYECLEHWRQTQGDGVGLSIEATCIDIRCEIKITDPFDTFRNDGKLYLTPVMTGQVEKSGWLVRHSLVIVNYRLLLV